MKTKNNCIKFLLTIILTCVVTASPVHAAECRISNENTIMPRFNNISSVSLGMGFDANNVVYCTIDADLHGNGTGISGIMKLYDSNGTCLNVWSVSDYEGLIFQEFSHQGVYGETYTATFEGYAYGKSGSQPDRLELTVTSTCKG